MGGGSLVAMSPPPSFDHNDKSLLLAAIMRVYIVSPGYEEKDRIGPTLYLEQAIADVVVYDPRIGEVVHFTPEHRTVHQAPVDLTFACGCAVTIPL